MLRDCGRRTITALRVSAVLVNSEADAHLVPLSGAPLRIGVLHRQLASVAPKRDDAVRVNPTPSMNLKGP